MPCEAPTSSEGIWSLSPLKIDSKSAGAKVNLSRRTEIYVKFSFYGIRYSSIEVISPLVEANSHKLREQIDGVVVRGAGLCT